MKKYVVPIMFVMSIFLTGCMNHGLTTYYWKNTEKLSDFIYYLKNEKIDFWFSMWVSGKSFSTPEYIHVQSNVSWIIKIDVNDVPDTKKEMIKWIRNFMNDLNLSRIWYQNNWEYVFFMNNNRRYQLIYSESWISINNSSNYSYRQLSWNWYQQYTHDIWF